MDTTTTEDGSSEFWLLPVLVSLIGGSLAAGGCMPGKFCGGILMAILSSAIALWGLESRVDIAEKRGVFVANCSEYAAGTKFLAGFLLFFAVFVPTVQPWYIGIGLLMRFILWPVLLHK